ncbi:MAG: magnesium/cobalt transporter CorA [Planctomycetota bacterium]
MSSPARPTASMFMKRYGYRATPGARPGSIDVPEGAIEPTIRVTSYDGNELQEHENASVDQIANLRGASQVTWIDIVGLGDADVIRRVGELLGLHRLALEDLVNIPQRSKVDHYGDTVFVVSQLPHPTRIKEVEQICFFVGKDFLLSWRERPSDCFAGVRERLKVAGRPLRKSNVDYLLYALLDAVIDAYFPALETIGENLDSLDEAMERGATNAIVGRIHSARHNVRLLRRIVWPLREAVDTLVTDNDWLIGAETSIYLRDCHDHTVQIIDTLESYREACADLRDYYATEVSNRMNEVMKVLTVIATIFIPLSFIAGVYGMNFDPEISALNMPETRWRWGYPAVLCLMATVAAAQLLFFRWRGWLGPRPRVDEKR